MTSSYTIFRVVLNARRRVVVALALSSALLSGCVDPVSIVASSVLSAAFKTAVEQAEKNRPTPEDRWHEMQLSVLEREARGGTAESQFRLGTYYIQTQESKAEVWICAAANQGHARAQLQYGHWFNEDRAREDLFPFINITPNNADAFLWYALAAQNGEPRASHFRDSLIYGGIQTVKLDQARARLANWSSQDCGSPTTATLTVEEGNKALVDTR